MEDFENPEEFEEPEEEMAMHAMDGLFEKRRPMGLCEHWLWDLKSYVRIPCMRCLGVLLSFVHCLLLRPGKW